MTQIPEALDWLTENRELTLSNLLKLMGIASVSNVPGHDEQLGQAADTVAWMFDSIGMRVEKKQIDGHVPPLVLVSDDRAGPDAPLVVFYVHYDVQPAGNGWTKTTAFEPIVTDGRIVGRGAGDDKGPLVAAWAACAACLRTGSLPVRVRFVIEGEEENGSGAIIKFLASPEGKAFIDGADSIVICDTLASPDGRPSITFGLRGLLYCRLTVYGPKNECHSGHVGGAVQDPGGALSWFLASIWDPQEGMLNLNDFDDAIIPLSDEARRLLASSPVSEQSVQHETGGVPAVIKIDGSTVAEQTGARPSFTVHSLLCGDTEPTSTPTNVPRSATAKFSIRLVPGLDPDALEAALRRHIEEGMTEFFGGTVTCQFDVLKRSKPVRFDPSSPQLAAAARAQAAAWGSESAFMLAGGSIPVVAHFEQASSAPIILWGGTNADSSFHGPDENLGLSFFHNSARGLVHLLYELAGVTA